jgi:hypothetical protein
MSRWDCPDVSVGTDPLGEPLSNKVAAYAAGFNVYSARFHVNMSPLFINVKADPINRGGFV